MSDFKVRPVTSFSAELTVPGDKSISHCAVILASLANGDCEIEGFLPSDDCRATVNAMRALGVSIEELNEKGDRLQVSGCRGKFTKPENPIDCGNSGTTMRLLSGLLASQPFESTLTGDEALSRRAMNRVATPLELMGASVRGKGDHCRPPLKIKGTKKPKAINYTLPVASAHVKNAVMLAALRADGKTQITEPSRSRDHAERILDYLLVKNIREENTVTVWGGQTPESRNIQIPGDISSAAFWIVAAAARPDARLLVSNIGLNPSRVGILNALARMGARINERIDESGCEPTGSVEVHGSRLKGIEISGDEIPALIDEVPILAVAAAMAEGKTIIRDAKELRGKESDRISAVAENLRRMGVLVEEFADGMEIRGGQTFKGAEINSLGDHRIAMAFAIAGLYAEGETVIRDTDCIEASYPGFLDELTQLMKADR